MTTTLKTSNDLKLKNMGQRKPSLARQSKLLSVITSVPCLYIKGFCSSRSRSLKKTDGYDQTEWVTDEMKLGITCLPR